MVHYYETRFLEENFKAMEIADFILEQMGFRIEDSAKDFRKDYAVMQRIDCPTCQGNGFIQIEHVDDTGKKLDIVDRSTCPTCSGQRQISMYLKIGFSYEYMYRLIKERYG